MKKRVIGTALATSILLTAFPVSSFAQNENIIVNGEQVSINSIMENDRLMVPINSIFEKLGAEVKWDKEKAEVLIEDNYTLVELFIGKDSALVYKKYDFSGMPLNAALEAAPMVIDDVVYVPLRFVAENINASVEWDNERNEALIKSKNSDSSVSYEVVKQNEVLSSQGLSKWYDDNKANKGIYFTKENNSTYVMISGGMMNTDGYLIKLNGIVQDNAEGLSVYASIENPSDNIYVTKVISYPCIIIKLNNTDIKKVNGAIY